MLLGAFVKFKVPVVVIGPLIHAPCKRVVVGSLGESALVAALIYPHNLKASASK